MRLGVGAKFTLTVLVILAGTMAVNTFHFLRTWSSFHEQQLEERGRALGRLISLISPEAILGFDFLLSALCRCGVTQTAHAVREFQSTRDLVADGEVGAATLKALKL